MFLSKMVNFFTTITIIITSFAISKASDTSNHFDECSSPWSCGNISDIGYPFWGIGRPKYCGLGLPDLQLQCPSASDGFPVLHIKDDYSNINVSLQVMSILRSTKRVMTVELQLNPNYSSLTSLYKNKIFQGYPFSFTAKVTVANLFYGCDPKSVNQSSKIMTCVEFDYSSDQPNGEDKGCSNFSIPVFRDELSKLEPKEETLKGMLQKGFEVNFDYSSCIKCLDSGGVCGSLDDGKDFMCHNKDHPPSKSEKWTLKLWLITGLGSVGGVVIISTVSVICYKTVRPTNRLAIFLKRRRSQQQKIEAILKVCGSLTPKRYTYTDIQRMTKNFKEKLGEGGFATVYKGKLLHDGRPVAVKLLKQAKGDGEDFINEVASIGRTNHVNVVSLLGFCIERTKRALIYEFMPNGSLERFTYRGASYTSLSWETVFNIALGIARGLDYLHQGCNTRILHFDIKPHNILLDNEFQPKISDFGLARLCPQQESSISALGARGTIGYIAPEVFCENLDGASHKADVYSYGMVILDLVCGRTNTSGDVHHSSEMYFPEWIHSKLEHDEELVSGILNTQEKELQRKMILVGLWCIQTHHSKRPSMNMVIEMLNGSLESIPMPPKPDIFLTPNLASSTSRRISTAEG